MNNRDINTNSEDEVFNDSSFFANFENSSIRETTITETNNYELKIKNCNQSVLNVSALCCDEEISGYDKLTGKTWIYPTNYPVRDYQFNIIRASILKNTLVSLPTGLGKTFIAAVIMYNFYRWYPLGKIVFTAPTRPLVAQQIDACYNIIAIPPKDTIEMTGHMQVNTRKTHWETKRVFFATPQVIYNDIKSGICPGEKIRCLVIDEAHRARGNYAYCQIVSTLTEMGHKTYRLLALSATPGSKVDDVITVVKNLHIAHLELRTENCIDVAPYSHSRKINTVIVQLGPELTQLRQQYVEILDGYARRLKQLNILPQNLGNLSKGRVVMLYKEFQCKERGARHPQHNVIMKDFTLLIALFHGLELLVKHGSRVFLNFFDEHPEKSWIQSDDKLVGLLERLRDDLGVNPLSLDRSILPDGTIPEMPEKLYFGHPKFCKLKEIMLEHFKKAKQSGVDTRAIVFCEYRESVNLVHCLLLQCRPLITPLMFVGQGASGKDGKTVVSQKQQMRVMRNFREGACNTLVATCVAEEGLDVGSVDLILCFDISTRSPVRLVQRCGRTGRERGGQVFILVTEGREHQTLVDCMRQRDGLNGKILQSQEVRNNLYKANPRMVPHDFMPECQKMYITVAKKPDPKGKSKDVAGSTKKGQKDLRNMFRQSTSSRKSNSNNAGHLISEEEFNDLFPSGYPYTEEESISKQCSDRGSTRNLAQPIDVDKLLPWLEWQRNLQKTGTIGHSRDSEVLVELLQYCDAKRFDLPTSTQNPAFTSQDLKTQNVVVLSPMKNKNTKKKAKNTLRSPSKKDGDIRALFSTATKSTKNYTKLLNDLGVPNDGSLSTRYINLLVDLRLENANASKKCYLCENLCECNLIKDIRKLKKKSTAIFDFKSDLKLPDIKLLDDVKSETIIKCSKLGTGNICSNVFSQDYDNDRFQQITNFNDSNNVITTVKEVTDNKKSLEENFDLGDIEDIFAESSPELIEEQNVKKDTDKNSSNPKETLEFFGLDSIEDIFADYDENSGDKTKSLETALNEVVHTKDASPQRPPSPSILSGKQRIPNIPTSPILCSQVKKHQLSTNKTHTQSYPAASTAKKRLNTDSVIDLSLNDNILGQNARNAGLTPNYLSSTNNKTMFSITQLVEMINKSECDSSTDKSKNVSKTTVNNIEKERSCSPILLTQADRRIMSNSFQEIGNPNKSTTSQIKKNESLIILDSDSDSDTTNVYSIDKNLCHDFCKGNTPQMGKTQPNNKRKLSDAENEVTTQSPYFNKRQRLINDTKKPLTLQEKVLAAFSSKNVFNSKNNINNSSNIYCAVAFPSPNSISQKENENPKSYAEQDARNDGQKDRTQINGISILQQFRRDIKNSQRSKPNNGIVNSIIETNAKKLITFSDSDDDFVDEVNSSRNKSKNDSPNVSFSDRITNHKVRKVSIDIEEKRRNEFLDEEAELSDSRENDSGDELTDESVGSIVDFICDDNDNVTHTETDMHAHYLRSVRSPVKGVFKIPQLPKVQNNIEIFSQFVEEDSYEMDSFCVDSHIGLTQMNEESELDRAEKRLKAKKRKKRKITSYNISVEGNGDSPIVRKRGKNVKRQINSDSDDSS